MKQHEAVILAIEKLGGVATLGQLYKEVFKIIDCKWGTKTPFASIRRIVQQRPEVFKIKPGLYGLTSKRAELESKGWVVQNEKNMDSDEIKKSDHTYYQGLLLMLGKMKGFNCWSPNQDRRKLFIDKPLETLRTLQTMPGFSYPHIVKRSETVDVIWFNQRQMPGSLFEIEHSTDIQNSLLKFNDLQDFNTRMLIVANSKREKEFESKIHYSSFQDIAKRVEFLSFDWLVKQYEHAVETGQQKTTL
ncbi:MAG: hypothetical protein ABSB84_03830 [Verrucomicrobiota bacterium]|jgi:hypothetical protein